ncbi:MAG: Mu transposase domain-containing protein [Ferrimicrobium sp.]
MVVERWILARLRNHRFRSIAEANQEIASLLRDLNNRVTRSLEASRQELFETIERPNLRPLPATPYEFATWKRAKVSIDYHIMVSAERHYYSVPYRLVGTHVEVRLSETTVQVFSQGVRVALHPRSPVRHGFSTDPSHMPASHRAHLEWTPSRLISWAQRTGPMTGALIEGILKSRPHPEQGYRSCLGIMRLTKTYPPERVEAASTRALELRSYSYRSVASILKNGLDTAPLKATPSAPGPNHDNLRGPHYYQ